MTTLLASLGFVAFSFALWPVIARFAQIPIVWTAVLVNAGSLLVALIFLAFRPVEVVSETRVLWLGLLAGIVNGVGFLVYSYVLSDTTVSASTVVALVDILIPLAALILGFLFLKETLSVYKALGVLMAILSIYLLIKK